MADKSLDGIEMKLLRRIVRVFAAFLMILVGGLFSGGSIAAFCMRHEYPVGFAFEEGAIMGGAAGAVLGLLLSIPVSYCRFDVYFAGAILGTFGLGIPCGLHGEAGTPYALYLSPLGFLFCSFGVFSFEWWRVNKGSMTKKF